MVRYEVWVLGDDDQWRIIKTCKTLAVAEVFKGLILENETKIIEVNGGISRTINRH